MGSCVIEKFVYIKYLRGFMMSVLFIFEWIFFVYVI